MAKRKKKKQWAVEAVQRRGAGLASTTRGRARIFKDRKKEQARRACRGKVNDE